MIKEKFIKADEERFISKSKIVEFFIEKTYDSYDIICITVNGDNRKIKSCKTIEEAHISLMRYIN